MEIYIYVNQKKIDKDYEAAMAEYTKRLMPFCKVFIKKVKDYSKPDISKDTVLYQVFPGTNTISSPELSNLIQKHNLNGYSRIVFTIFENNLSAEALTYEYPIDTIEKLSLSTFSMSKDLTTVVLCEQLYRAYTILNNITYHK